MSDNSQSTWRANRRGDERPLAAWRLILAVCNEFEAAWSSPATEPQLSSFLARYPQCNRSLLLIELVELELEFRLRRGEQDPWPDLIAANAEIAEELQILRDNWDCPSVEESSWAVGNGLTSETPEPSPGLRIRCPHCHESVRMAPDAALGGIECDFCGSSFSLIDETTDTLQAQTVSQIGHFELVERLGLGSFGAVWKARDTRLDRTVAVKIPRKGELDGDEAERFLREARAAAQLNHPNIVRIHEVGRAGDILYIVSDFIRGVSLAESLAERRYAPRDSARIAATIARALHHAHECGVIHRDLKSANVILDGQNEPHVLDFGLAKREGREVTMTVDGVILGTPAYMSPEQSKGDVKAVDRRTDIYSLGVVLFELLTGERPFHGTSRALLHKKQTEEPPSPRAMDPTISRDLETICLGCLARLPEHRYGSAQQVANDLECWLTGKPISARPVSRLEQLNRWCHRRPAEAALIAAIMLGSAGILWLLWVNIVASRRVVGILVDNYVTTDVEHQAAGLRQIRDDLGAFDQEIVRRMGRYGAASREGLLLRLAVLSQQPELADELIEAYLSMNDELARSVDGELLLAELRPYAARFLDRLWQDVLMPEVNIDRRRWIRSASALAAFDDDRQRWQQLSDQLVDRLLIDGRQDWISDFQSVGQALAPRLEHYFDRGTDDQQVSVARVLAVYRAGQPNELLKLLYRARPGQFDYLLRAIAELPPQSRAPALADVRRVAGDDSCMATPGQEGERQVQRRANAVLALMLLGDAGSAWPSFAHSADPRLQSYLVHLVSTVGIPPTLLIDRLYVESDPDVVYTLLLSLGQFEPDRAIDPGMLEPLKHWLWNSYDNHGDSGVHAAIHWLLRRWGHGKELDERDLHLAASGTSEGRDWYHNRLGQLMVLVRHPREFYMGVADEESPSKNVGPRQLVVPPRPFAIAATETTLRDYRRYRPGQRDDFGVYGSSERPVHEKSLYEALGYCEWLTQVDRGSSENVDVPAESEEGAEIPPNFAIDLETTGYRPPTETEWEYACRAGSLTTRFFGGEHTLFLDDYAIIDPATGTMAVSQAMPNRLGLFDTYGNVSEWTVDAFDLPESRYDLSLLRNISRDRAVVVRGGGFSTSHNELRSALRLQVIPYSLQAAIGFRVARLIPPLGN